MYQLHLGDVPLDVSTELRTVCDEFVREGLIRAYAWDTHDPERAALLAEGEHCAGLQHAGNVLTDAPEMPALCERRGLASIVRSPLAIGLLTSRQGVAGRGAAGDIRLPERRPSRGERDGPPPSQSTTYSSCNRDLRGVAVVWRHQRATNVSSLPRLRYSQVVPGATSPLR
ncbi:hypothetical protein [Streptomyces sp. NPDC088258]|uniref:hypothetical protein n=1 Tax=Streptomyces sp. NPDC088258 TaxID=3365849 RepID=UPI00382C5732